MPRAHPFLYAGLRRCPDFPVHLALPRDREAASQLEKALRAEGYESGTSVLNFPARDRCYELLPVDSLFQVSLPFLEEGDVLFQATRPPLSDAVQDDRKKVEPSNSSLERVIFMHWWRYLDFCSRSRIVLSEEVASLLPAGYRDRQEMNFLQKDFPYVFLQEKGRRRSRRFPVGERTPGFLLRVDEIYPGGPGFVAAWGVNAMMTLAWCRRLRSDHSHLLQNRGLTMVELMPDKVPARPLTYEFTDAWGIDVLFETGVEMPPGPEEANFAISL